MIRLLGCGVVGVFFMGGGVVFGEAAGEAEKGIVYGSDIAGVRLKLVEKAEEVAKKYAHFEYKFGGSSPEDGGFDCSGAMYYVMGEVGLKPPRTSAQQYTWVRDAGHLTLVGAGVVSLDDPVFGKLKPGDLLFWSGTYVPTDGRSVDITHVAIYLGKERDGRQVMANATSGRSYRGKKGSGYGIFDFKLPSKASKSKFVGYGSPVGLEDGVVVKKVDESREVVKEDLKGDAGLLLDACWVVALMNLKEWENVDRMVEGEVGLVVLKKDALEEDWCGVGAFLGSERKNGDVILSFRYGARVDSPHRVLIRFKEGKGKPEIGVLGW